MPLIEIISGALELRGFFGGIILRGEGQRKEFTGRISIVKSEKPFNSTIKNHSASLLSGVTGSVKLGDHIYLGSMLMWTEWFFSQFGFDLIAMMQGTYQSGSLSSFHGMGASKSQ
jgi:hypothetical protein